MKVAGKTVILTGAGSGIGRSLAMSMIERGAKVAALDMNEQALDETLQLTGNSEYISKHVLNVMDAASMPMVIEEVISRHGSIDALINNAGIIQPFVRVSELKTEDIERVMAVNFTGTLNLIRIVLPHLLQRKEAHIVNISSMGGFLPVPGQAIYGASKAAVKLLTEALYAELKSTGVRVTIVFPGAIATNITMNSGVTVPGSTSEASKKKYQTLSSDKAANIILDGMEKDKFRILVGNDARLMDLLYRISPGFATRFIAKQMRNLLS